MGDKDTASIVEQAMARAESGASDVESVVDDATETVASDAGSDSGTETETAESDATPEQETVADVVAEVAEASDKPTDDVVKFLIENGLKGFALNDKLPAGRARKIVYNALKKQADAHAEALKTRDTELTITRQAKAAMDRWDQLVMNPSVAIERLAQANPLVWGPILDRMRGTAEPAKPAAKALPAEDDDPRPKPDIEYTPEQGGGVGYKPETWDKLQEWERRQARRELIAENDKIMKPLRMKQEAQDEYNKRVEAINDVERQLIEDYGNEYANEKTKGEILTLMRERGWGGVNAVKNLARAAGIVISKQRKITEDEMEANIRKRLKNAPSAARRTPGASSGTGLKSGSASTEGMTTEQIVASKFARASRA